MIISSMGLENIAYHTKSKVLALTKSSHRPRTGVNHELTLILALSFDHTQYNR